METWPSLFREMNNLYNEKKGVIIMTFILAVILFVVGVIGGSVIGYKISAYSSKNLYYAAKMNELINQNNRNES